MSGSIQHNLCKYVILSVNIQKNVFSLILDTLHLIIRKGPTYLTSDYSSPSLCPLQVYSGFTGSHCYFSKRSFEISMFLTFFIVLNMPTRWRMLNASMGGKRSCAGYFCKKDLQYEKHVKLGIDGIIISVINCKMKIVNFQVFLSAIWKLLFEIWSQTLCQTTPTY